MLGYSNAKRKLIDTYSRARKLKVNVERGISAGDRSGYTTGVSSSAETVYIFTDILITTNAVNSINDWTLKQKISINLE